jgi:hypothetical protein
VIQRLVYVIDEAAMLCCPVQVDKELAKCIELMSEVESAVATKKQHRSGTAKALLTCCYQLSCALAIKPSGQQLYAEHSQEVHLGNMTANSTGCTYADLPCFCSDLCCSPLCRAVLCCFLPTAAV